MLTSDSEVSETPTLVISAKKGGKKHSSMIMKDDDDIVTAEAAGQISNEDPPSFLRSQPSSEVFWK